MSNIHKTQDELIGKLKSPQAFEFLKNCTNSDLEAHFGTLVPELGGSSTNIATVNRCLELVVFEITRRENNRSFKIMLCMTAIAILVSAIPSLPIIIKAFSALLSRFL